MWCVFMFSVFVFCGVCVCDVVVRVWFGVFCERLLVCVLLLVVFYVWCVFCDICVLSLCCVLLCGFMYVCA